MRLIRLLIATQLGSLAAIGVTTPDAAYAQGDPGAGASHRQLEHQSVAALALETAAVGALVAVPELLWNTPSACHWCEPTSFDRSVRSALVAKDPKWVGYISHVVSLGFVPAWALGGSFIEAADDEHWERGLQDAWIVTNAVLLTTALGNTVKKNVARQRPAFYNGVEDRTEAVDFKDQQFLSFYSLDTAWAFSIAASGATLAYLRGYDSAPWLLGGGAALATTAGVLRISADMHWATDVATGALMGTLVGVGLPLLMHRRSPLAAEGVATQITPQGLSISGVF